MKPAGEFFLSSWRLIYLRGVDCIIQTVSGPAELNHLEYPAAFAMATWVSSYQAFEREGGRCQAKNR